VCAYLCYHVSMNCTNWPNMPCGFDVESLVDFETALTSTSAAFQSGGHCDDWTAISDFDSEALALIKDTQLDSSEFRLPLLVSFHPNFVVFTAFLHVPSAAANRRTGTRSRDLGSANGNPAPSPGAFPDALAIFICQIKIAQVFYIT
jgi:hypothetical protein